MVAVSGVGAGLSWLSCRVAAVVLNEIQIKAKQTPLDTPDCPLDLSKLLKAGLRDRLRMGFWDGDRSSARKRGFGMCSRVFAFSTRARKLVWPTGKNGVSDGSELLLGMGETLECQPTWRARLSQ